MLTPTPKSLLRNWWPVIFWLVVIRAESTDSASASNTSEILYNAIAYVVPHVEPAFVDRLDEVLRKTGHFAGYGILAALVLFALRNTNRDRLRPVLRRTWGIHMRDLWRREWATLGVLVTVVTASFDELHQHTIPSRTGRWQDVVLDSCGAVIASYIMYLLSKRTLKHRQEADAQVELSSAP